MFVENVAAFFDQTSGFAVAATWKPGSGGAAISGSVILDMPDEIIGAFQQDIINTNYRINFATATFPGLREGEYMTVDGKQYRLHESPRLLADGAISEAQLTKLP